MMDGSSGFTKKRHEKKLFSQQKELLRNTIKMLLETGKTPSEIADNLHLDIDDVNELI
jgi:hypothetical protein